MPGIPETVIDDIRDRLDLVDVIGGYVPLKRRGNDFWGLCPFHKEKTSSFKVDAQRQLFYCFGCKKSGNVFGFIMAIENVDFVGAVEILAHRSGIMLPDPEPQRSGTGTRLPAGENKPSQKKQLYDCMDKLSGWYHELLATEEARPARLYLQERGLDQEAVGDFKLGYAPDSWDSTLKWGERHGFNREVMIAAGLVVVKDDKPGDARCYDRFRGRLMFPIWDELGRVVGFSARTLNSEDKSAKYINSPETVLFRKNRLLYGLHTARNAFKEHGGALVCEGQLDVIACHRAGLKHAVSAQGTAFTENHARLLKRFTDKVTLAFDADTAGQKAAVATLQLLFQVELNAEVVVLPEGSDPDSIFTQGGAEALQAIISETRNALDFLFDLTAQLHDLQTAAGKTAAVQSLLQVVVAQPNAITRASACQWIAGKLQIQENALFEAMNNLLKLKQRRATGSAYGRNRAGNESEPVPASSFQAISVSEKVEAALLDLALHFDFVAHELAERILPESLSDSLVGRALNIVLAFSSQGEWHLATAEIVKDHALASDPSVARLLTETRFADLDPVNLEEDQQKKARVQLLQAAEDCLCRMELQRIETRLQSLPQALADEKDSVRARELQQEFFDLIQKKHQLKNGAVYTAG